MSEALYDKEVKCPVCDMKFKTKKVKTSHVKVVKRDSDFCAYYKDENPTFMVCMFVQNVDMPL